jgi:hypothetical protein
MPVGTLAGMAVPTLVGLLDHTYVVSDQGHRWRCWGRDFGGGMICSAHGNVLEADCLSQVDSEAGIVYGKTGVCHQSANRILYPARLVVTSARGAGLSMFAWGFYGLSSTGDHYDPLDNPWPELVRCRATHQHP